MQLLTKIQPQDFAATIDCLEYLSGYAGVTDNMEVNDWHLLQKSTFSSMNRASSSLVTPVHCAFFNFRNNDHKSKLPGIKLQTASFDWTPSDFNISDAPYACDDALCI